MSEKPLAAERDVFKPRYVPHVLLVSTLMLALLITLYYAVTGQGLSDVARVFTALLSAGAVLVALVVMPRHYAVGFLACTLLMLTNWRVAAMMGIWPIMWSSALVALVLVIALFDLMRRDWLLHAGQRGLGIEWQMTVVRIYFGFDMVGHFTEKLFAGTASFHHMAEIFAGFGVPSPQLFVLVGGLCELGIAIGIGMGFLTRLAALGGALYFMIANHYGAHFDNGFTWANGPDGGWEYPLLMAVFYLSFALSGGGRFSVDGWLMRRGLMPAPLRGFCVHRSPELHAH